uniref:LIM/homeobox protein Lhx9-like n=1 Tax=Timema tahoe TaxID=61484 RepID=A0A7R9INZ7_9NEOP|nr:unnamed protein product [Timema tahoe]
MLKDREATGPTAASPCGGPEPSVCGGCGGRITDRYYLLAVDRSWHSACLKCCECKLPLDSELTCFARDGNIYCKEDYYRLFAVKRCGRCQAGISASELVMRARDLVYHLHCFTCVSCGGALSKGDHFGMKDGLVYCRPHYEQLLYTHEAVYCGDLEAVFGGSPAHYFAAGEMLHPGDLSSSMESLGGYDTSASSPGNPGSQQRTKRMRTSFKHHQLRTMKSYFAINQNPDAKDLKQLAQKTGLSKRVLQVWFQNARAKWRRNLMRQESGQPPTGAPPGSASSIPGGPPSVGSASLILGDSNSLPPAPQSEDMHHHHHHSQQTTPTLSFADLY